MAVILGDYSDLCLCIRTYAPTPEDLLRHMPASRSETKLESWEDYSNRHEWAGEALSIMYVGNFIHELIHHLQFTTRLHCAHRTWAMHNIGALTHDLLCELRDAELWPFKLPLCRWIPQVAGEEGERWWKDWMMTDMYLRFWEADEDFVRYYCKTIEEEQSDLFPDPFNPRVADLDLPKSHPHCHLKGAMITPRMLLEGEATLLEWRFLATFYGQEIATALWDRTSGGELRGMYDILPLVAIGDGMLYLFPILVDWAFQGPHGEHHDGDYKHYHPSWRFASLYKAAREFRDKDFTWVIDHYEELIDQLSSKTCLPAPAVELKRTIAKLEQQALSENVKAVYRHNLQARLAEPELFWLPEANWGILPSRIAIPAMVHRGRPTLRYSPGARILNPIEMADVTHGGRSTFNILWMIENQSIRCPFCELNALQAGSVPDFKPLNVGPMSRGVEGQTTCSCGWSLEFQSIWKIWPQEIEAINEEETKDEERRHGVDS